MLTPRTLLCLVLPLLACEEEHLSDTIQVQYSANTVHHSQETLDEAAELLGMEIRDLYTYEPGWAVRALVLPATNSVAGETFYLGKCARMVWSVDKGSSLAHELGHATGLQHVDDPNNLMYPIPGDELTDQQIHQMRRGAWTIQHCGLWQGRTTK